MSATGIIWTVVTALIFMGLVALSLWMRKWDAEDFEQGPSSLSEDDRRRLQFGIGLTSNSMGGSGC